MNDYTIIKANDVKNYYEGSDVPGEFRPLTKALNNEQVALSLIRVPAHSDFEQSTGHYHDEIEEVYIITKGTLTMRIDDEIKKVEAGSVIRIAPKTTHSHRNEGEEDVEMWAISKQLGRSDGHKVDDFWEASPDAKQTK